jgi:hypothetical protein
MGLRWSNGIMFLLTVMPHLPSVSSATLPLMPSGVTSTSIRWLSVPPLTNDRPPAARTSARVLALARIWRA